MTDTVHLSRAEYDAMRAALRLAADATCQYGHPREGNTYIRPTGVRQCVICQRQASARYRERRRQAPFLITSHTDPTI